MTPEGQENPLIVSTDEALSLWRQGDCVLGEHWFVHRLERSMALTEAGRVAATAGSDLAEQEVQGFVVVTQTCDIVRTCCERPFVELCPLVKVDEQKLREIQKGRRPAYAYLPLLSPHGLVADLDRVMTIEKPLLRTWQRTPGWCSEGVYKFKRLAFA